MSRRGTREERSTHYALTRSPEGPVPAPTLDPSQQAVVDHAGGPLLVLAGPGTGKTTTLVEAIVDRVESGAAPDSVLALTFSRKAAEQLRDRVTARLGRTTSTSMVSTFHSFAYGLIRLYSPPDLYAGPLRLLSAPEQDVVLRELLHETPESVPWPDALRRAAETRGFAHEVASVLGRAREKGLDGEQLTALGRDHDLPEFVAAGQFLEQYLTVLDDLSATDYADLIRRATLEARVHQEELRRRFTHVFVDEYQDTDPGQVALLRALAGDGRNLTVVGDPHQSIYGFRGADVRGILDFPREFPRSDGAPADVVALGTTRRFGPRLLTAAQRVAHRLPLPGALPPEARDAFLTPHAEGGDLGPGRVDVAVFDTERAESEHLADLLRRAHLEDGIGWDEMAVLVRSGRGSIPALRRSLGAAGVPVEVAGDDVPLVRDPSVRPLLDALRVVLNLENDDPGHVDFIDPGRVEALLMSPLGGLDAGDVRRLARELRAREKRIVEQASRDGANGDEEPAPLRPRSSRELLRLAVVGEDFLAGLDGPEVARAKALHALVARARAQVDDGASTEEVLWTIWSGTSWPSRLRQSVESGGGSARRAHRDLDSVVALFSAAARAEEQRDHVGVRSFVATLVAQQLPGDTLAEQGVRGSAVRLLTAHRSKGLEWRLVVVAHVQAEGWPDLRRRSTLLQADRIGVDGLVPPVSSRELLVEERRLFYVACTRARQRLVVTAVASPEDDGEQPSRFIDELGVEPRRVTGRPPRPLSMAGLVSELRRVGHRPGDQPRPAPGGRGAARPARRRGVRRPAARAAGRPGHLVGHPLPEPLDAGRPRPRPAGAGLGQRAGVDGRLPGAVVPRARGGRHPTGPPVRQRRTAGARPRRPGRPGRGHQRSRRRRGADGARRRGLGPAGVPHARGRGCASTAACGPPLERFLRWHYAAHARELLGTEQHFATEVVLDDGETVRISGYADRVEVDAEGQLVVVDLKSGRTPAEQQVGGEPPPARALPVRRGPRRDGRPAARARGHQRRGRARAARQARRLHPTPRCSRSRCTSRAVRSATVLRGELARAAAYLRTESFPATPGAALPALPVRPRLPVTQRRGGAVAVRRIDSPADLRAVMHGDYEVSPQQWAAISAPLAPAVVIAGAGSGKTTLMAARVVYLVVTGQVRPDEVLGLTFTTKAASELRGRVREALVTAGVLGIDRPTERDEDPDDELEPTVVTYNAYASNLLAEHGLRIGHEPDTRVITDASRYQLGARAVERYVGDVHVLSDHPPTVIQNLLALDGSMTEHLVDPARVLRARRRGQGGVRPRARGGGRGQEPHHLPRPVDQGDLGHRPARRPDGTGEVLPPAQGRALADGLRRPDRARRTAGRGAARGRGPGAGEVQGRDARRVPGHLGRPGPDARPAVLRPDRRAAGWATRSPPSATPTRPSTAGAGRRSPTSSASVTPSRQRPARCPCCR